MKREFNIYCDESCHLENDHQIAMVLGAIWCPRRQKDLVFRELRKIKLDFGLSQKFEIKWTKVSPAKLDFYKALVEYFFRNENLNFRALIVPDKTILNHSTFAHDHDAWYYKMYFDLLKVILAPDGKYKIYLDIKDTQGTQKINTLHDVLCNNMYDFSREIIENIQLIRSEEVEIVQLADLLIGAVSYTNRGLVSSKAKVELINFIKQISGYNLIQSTLLKEEKFNLFRWQAREVQKI